MMGIQCNTATVQYGMGRSQLAVAAEESGQIYYSSKARVGWPLARAHKSKAAEGKRKESQSAVCSVGGPRYVQYSIAVMQLENKTGLGVVTPAAPVEISRACSLSSHARPRESALSPTEASATVAGRLLRWHDVRPDWHAWAWAWPICKCTVSMLDTCKYEPIVR